MNETKIVSASVRVSLSLNYNTFEVALNVENESGLTNEEISLYRLKAHDMANEAVEDYKALNNVEIKSNPIVNNSRIADIEKLPMYKEVKNKIQPTSNHKEFERMTYLINDCITIKELMKLKKDVPVELNDIFNQKFAEIGDATNEK